ncbi:hypothetical protein [Ruegeria intermedia]|uniref:hypothetical protein n=1 Tax=Ruegeria intermedia TaxID=996115 RepID=UPI00122C7DA8|nr:hypothetical protein [Ruegeria intermedia]
MGLATAPLPAAAQSNAASIAAALQSWRDACSDPNPDLVIGYMADAVATASIEVRKACLRQVFASDNVDLRSAALRITITSLPRIRFRVSPESANHNFYGAIQTGLIFEAAEGDLATGTAKWFPLVKNSQPSDDYSGTVAVLGTGIVWKGRVYGPGGVTGCSLSADLAEGAALQGIIHCGNQGTYPVAADLLD